MDEFDRITCLQCGSLFDMDVSASDSVILTPDVLFVERAPWNYPSPIASPGGDFLHGWCNVDCFGKWIAAKAAA